MTNTDIQAAYVGSSEAVKVYLGTDIVWQKQSPVPPGPDLPYSAQPFTIEVLDTSGGDEIKFLKIAPMNNQQSGATKAPDRKLYYTINIPFTHHTTWTSNNNPWKKNGQYDVHVLESNGTISGLSSGDTIRFYTFVENSYNQDYPPFDGTQYCGTFGESGRSESVTRTQLACNSFGQSTVGFSVYGNILSLITSGWVDYSADVPGYQPVTRFDNLYWVSHDGGYNMFLGLFSCCGVTDNIKSKLADAENLVLPEDVTSGCYYRMFAKTQILNPPVLPATVMKRACYANMFNLCRNLAYAPELPAVTLNVGCCENMFVACALIESVFLPANSGATSCYYNMFNGCSRLSEVTCLLTNQNTGMTGSWLRNVSQTGTFYKSSGATWSSGTSGIPTGWTTEDYVEPAAENTWQ